MENKAIQAKQGLEYAKSILNSITVMGIDNCQKISAVYNNIEVFLSMVTKGEILITDNVVSNGSDEQMDINEKLKQ